MFPYTYSELNAQYNYLIRELSYCPEYIPGSNDSDNFTPFYQNIAAKHSYKDDAL